MSKGTYTGSKVKLLRDVTTRGGTTFKAGCVMRCIGADRGGLMLHCFKRGFAHMIRAVESSAVVVLEWGTELKETPRED